MVLAWGCLSFFFGIPLIVFSLHLANLASPSTFIEHLKEFRYMAEYLKTITAIIISLAGLHTVEIFKK